MYRSWMKINLVICLYFMYSHAEPAHKRLPMGFQGMRGKKSFDFTTADDYPDLEPLSRLQNYLLDQQADHYYPYYKRAPTGFLGMRGKKESDNMFMDADSLYGFDNEEKRGLKGFQGMRGKKEVEYPIFSYPNKRKTMGFQGMRGKKDTSDDLGSIYGETSEFNNDLSNNPDMTYPYLSAFGFSGNDYDKRGLRGFQGMRGKRGFDVDSIAQEKRVPSGFVGMRGKKDEMEDKAEQNIDEEFNEETSKHNGMKEVVGTTILPTPNMNEQILGLDNFGEGDASNSRIVKRSPNFGFYGVRGKKMPYFSTYFGTRGKKGPFDSPFRGKFVGVRGKKSDEQFPSRFLWVDDYQKRRGPSGFIGMRGKKSVSPDEANVFAENDGTDI